MFAPEFQTLKRVFAEMLEQPGLHSAAQVVVRFDGQVVVNHAAGRGTDESTPFLCFSITKAFTGLCIHKLIEEGKIGIDEPVARYWPAFGSRGKESATIRHVFLHQAGIPAPRLEQQVFTWPFWPLVTRHVAASRAVFPPGTQTAYHLVNYGFIFGEVIRRVTGMHVEDYLRQSFLEPMGLENTWLRLPKHLLPRTPRLEASARVMRQPSRLFNTPAIRTARLPAASLHSTAADLAAVFQMLLDDGRWQDRQLLKPETVRFATSSGYHGWDSYIRHPMHWGYGFILGARNGDTEEMASMGRHSSHETFSAMGMGTNMVWADRPARAVVAFTCNGMLPNKEASQRWERISNAAWEGLELMGYRNDGEKHYHE